MSPPVNVLRLEMVLGAECADVDPDLVCRDESCQELSVHLIESGLCNRKRRGRVANTRSKIFAAEPWRAYCRDALHESVYAAISISEPRNFSSIIHLVNNDYGSCCERSVHRHLSDLRNEELVVRMDFGGRIHAYLRAGSRLLVDRALVFEQIMNLHACEAS